MIERDMKTNQIIKIVVILFALGFFIRPLFAEEKIETMSGKVYEVFPSEDELTVATAKPDSAAMNIIQIKVDSETKYAGVTSLGGLQLDQLIKVKFVQKEDGIFLAKGLEVSEVKAPSKEKVKPKEIF